MKQFFEGDKVVHIPTGIVYTVDWRTVGSSTTRVMVKEIDGGWFHAENLARAK